MQIRQGDILLVSAKIPHSVTPVQAVQDRYVLAEGEATGHAHCVVSEKSGLFRDEKLNKLFLKSRDDFKGPLAGMMVTQNKKWFIAQTELRKLPVKFSRQHARFEDGVIECGPFSLLDHDEHYSEAVPVGDYEVIRQVEYSPQAIRQVAD